MKRVGHCDAMMNPKPARIGRQPVRRLPDGDAAEHPEETNCESGMARAGRPRKQWVQGRLSRAATRGEVVDERTVEQMWASFALATDPDGTKGPPADHPLYTLARFGRLDAGCFAIALYWVATRHSVARDWNCRKFISDSTGFDFQTEDGCKAARRWITDRVGKDVLDRLDRAVFRGEFVENTDEFEMDLREIWASWAIHRRELRCPPSD